MALPASSLISFAEYLRLEEQADHRSEWFDGQVFAMAGGSIEHARLAATVTGLLHAQLRGKPCLPYSSDLRVRVLATGLATYPDVTVICGPPEVDPASPQTATNPTVIVEVLSDGTEAYDRGEKFVAHYQKIPSLRDYVLVSQREARIEVFRRNDDLSWTLHVYRSGDTALLASVDCTLAVDDVFGR